jgi:ATP-binding cassette subfamily F protein uup
MDKVVDHLLVFKGQAEIKDFPGNYTQYRESEAYLAKGEKQKGKGKGTETPSPSTLRPSPFAQIKLSFNEKRELEALDKEIPALEAEQKALEQALSSGTLSSDELLSKSQRISQIIDELDEKIVRWIELSEIAGNL